MINITFKRHAKVIIVGEHAVVRGYPGIVVPHQHLNITCRYQSHLANERIGNCHKTQWVLDQHFDTIWEIVQIHFEQPRAPSRHVDRRKSYPYCIGMWFFCSILRSDRAWLPCDIHPSDDTIYHLAKN